ncbi:hypothetical protein BLA13014_00430 [Burkholderia aenigmatica]|uniref:Uncharacterized protein n=1 Tax=Burkholderia aenigmatica TaxID=2015348 RepID=A0A6P2HCX9_9BURK|nr:MULTISPECIES: hypothetical protein [Burkholderia]VWB15408.1 hypothetical protein BLA13014_00430 [Burkholderia aenigmatica]
MTNETLLPMLVSAVLNAAVTWGVVKTQLAWLRRDVDSLLKIRDALLAQVLKLQGE